MKNPTHKLVFGDTTLALFRFYKNGRTDVLLHGERRTSYSPSLQADCREGFWRNALCYLFGPDCDAIPDSARIVEIRYTKLHSNSGE